METYNISNKDFKTTLTRTVDASKITFYTIDKDLRPIPYNSTLVFFLNNADGTLKSITIAYDPYDKVQDAQYMLVWLQPVPYSTPLNIYKTATGIYLSFQNENLPPAVPETMYVLTSPDQHLPSIYAANTFKVINGDPKFTFSRDFGRCIPDVNSSMNLAECLRNFRISDKDITLIDTIGFENAQRRRRIVRWIAFCAVVAVSILSIAILKK